MMENVNEIDELEQLLLLAASDETLAPDSRFNAKPPSTNTESVPQNFNFLANTQLAPTQNGTRQNVKLVEDGIDSSDEEDLQNFLEQKYNEYGRGLNSMIKQANTERQDSFIDHEVTRDIYTRKKTPAASRPEPTIPSKLSAVRPSAGPSYQPKSIENINIYTDPVFGLRIVQPLVSSSLLMERMVGRTPVDIRNLDYHLTKSDLNADWCMGGVIVSKSAVQTSQKGAQYIIWKLSDLKGDMKQISLFLFKNAYKELWKNSQGTAIAVLNPSLFPRKEGRSGDISLTIDSAQKVMILGRSKDLGTCKSKKKNGEPCTAVVNINICEYCVYHVKQEYGKMSSRSDLQSASSGRGLQSLRNKVLGKNEVFYGGQSFVAEPAKKNKKLAAKDQNRLMTLSDHFQASPLAAAISARPAALTSYGTNRPVSRVAEGIDINVGQRKKDLERLNLLKAAGSSSSVNTSLETASQSNSSSQSRSSVPLSKPSITFSNGSSQLISPKTVLTNSPSLTPSLSFSKAPKLSGGSFSFTVDRNAAAKSKALEILKKKPMEKSNPNLVKYRGTENGKKRLIETIGISADGEDENMAKKRKHDEAVEAFKNERIKKILAATSSHTDLIQSRENQEQDKYFDKLEKKEMMEEKMVNTRKMDCKAVICSVCKYKAFSAAERCKTERHPLKVVDAEKRFFECEDCGNRVASLFRIPKITCSNCQSSRWKRTGMMREKKSTIGEQLSIRGDEETFIGSLKSNGNVNLCVAAD